MGTRDVGLRGTKTMASQIGLRPAGSYTVPLRLVMPPSAQWVFTSHCNPSHAGVASGPQRNPTSATPASPSLTASVLSVASAPLDASAPAPAPGDPPQPVP